MTTSINMREWARDIIESPQVAAIPIMTYPGLNLTGKSIMDAVMHPNEQVACMLALARRYPSKASVTMMDLSLEAEAFGAVVRFSDAEVPTVAGRLVADLESAQSLVVPAVGSGRSNLALETIRMAVAEISDRPVFGGLIGPFSLAGRLLGLSDIVLSAMRMPAIVHLVLEKCTQFLVEYAKAIKQAGANGIVMAEPAAGLLSPRLCDAFSSKYVARVVEAVQDDRFMVILHNCGNTTKLVSSLLSTGAAALHVGNAVRMAEIASQMPSDRLLMGNIEPAGIFRVGSTDQVRNAVLSLLDEMMPFPNFVLSSGCDIPPGTPIENVDTFFQTLESHNTVTAVTHA